MYAQLDVEDTLCKAFVLTLGAGMPNYTTTSDMISWIRRQAREAEIVTGKHD